MTFQNYTLDRVLIVAVKWGTEHDFPISVILTGRLPLLLPQWWTPLSLRVPYRIPSSATLDGGSSDRHADVTKTPRCLLSMLDIITRSVVLTWTLPNVFIAQNNQYTRGEVFPPPQYQHLVPPAMVLAICFLLLFFLRFYCIFILQHLAAVFHLILYIIFQWNFTNPIYHG